MRVFLLFSHCFRRFFHMSNLDVSLNTKKNERIQQQHTLEGRNTHVCSGTLCLLAVAQEFWIILYKINAIVDTYISTFVENTNEKVKRWTKKIWWRSAETIERALNNESWVHGARQHSNPTNRRHWALHLCCYIHTNTEYRTPTSGANTQMRCVAHSINTQSNKMHN